MNYIWFNADKSIKKFNIGYLVQESSNVDELYIFTDDSNMNALNCYVRFKRADSLVLGDFDCEYGSYLIDGSSRFGWRLNINTNVLKVAGQLGITVIFRKTVNNVVQDYAQCYVTTIVLKSVEIATNLELMLQEYMNDFQPKLTAGSNIIISGTVIDVKLANALTNSNEVPSCDLVKRYIDDMNDGFFEGLGQVLDEINGDVSESKLETPVIYIAGNVLTFNAITDATSYTLYSNGSSIATIYSSPYNLSNVITATGTYSIQLRANGEDITSSDLSNSVVYTKSDPTPQLDAPVISVSDNVVSWDAITGATSYEIYNSEGGTPVLLATTNTNSYNFSALADGTYIFSVIAKADGYITSSASNSVTYTKTTIVTQYVLHFNLNDANATGNAPADLTVNDGTVVDLTQYNSGFALAGSSFIGWNTDSSAESGLNTITVTQNTTVYAIWNPLPKLDTPTGLAINGTQLSWSAVTNATTYKVYANNTLIGTTTALFFNFGSILTNPGTYYLTLQAVATGYVDSNITSQSNNLKYVKTLPKMPTPVVTLNDKTISWNAVSLVIDGYTYNATYKVYADGTELASIGTSTSYNLSGAFNQTGTYSITVIATGLSGIYVASDESNAVPYSFVANPSYNVNFRRADNVDDSYWVIGISSPAGNLSLVDVNDSGTLTFTESGVQVTITYDGGSYPIEDGTPYLYHEVGHDDANSSGNVVPATTSLTKNYDATYTETITINGACVIDVKNTGTNTQII